MKRILFFLTASLLASPAFAAPVVINDGYVGGSPNDFGFIGVDVIGQTDLMSVTSMDVDVVAGNLVVNVYSTYFDNVGQSGTALGDLFISTNGWSPFGSAPYVNDTAANGEVWEYALVLDNHGPQNGPVSMLGTSGSASLYAVQAAAQIALSNPGTGTFFRANQETQFLPFGAQALALGSWSISDQPGSVDRLQFLVPFSALGFAPDLGFHWTMTCGNDVIEGGATVPEPTSLSLMGISMLLVAFRRRAGAAS